MEEHEKDFFEIKLNFNPLLERYRQLQSTHFLGPRKKYLESLEHFVRENPTYNEELPVDALEEHQEGLELLLGDLFPIALTNNEIKAATPPFSDQLFYMTDRFSKILNDAPDNFELSFLKPLQEDLFRRACGAILRRIYNKNIDLSRPIHAKIKDDQDALRTYRVTYNADYMRVKIKDEQYRLSEERINDLMRQHDNLELWKASFPFEAYSFEGFGILTLTDITVESAIADIKAGFLSSSSLNGKAGKSDLVEIFRKIYSINDLLVGFTSFNTEQKLFEGLIYGSVPSYLLGHTSEKHCFEALCHKSHDLLMKDQNPLVIPDLNEFAKMTDNFFIVDNLIKEGLNSAIFYPIISGERLIGIMELVSPTPYALNHFNLKLLDEVATYVEAALLHKEHDYENSIKALIQTECTSIHKSVGWKFQREARRILQARLRNESPSFEDITFENVYPLYGQIDIVGSSQARSNCIAEDILDQLGQVKEIFAESDLKQSIPLFDQLMFRVDSFVNEIEGMQTDASTEQTITRFLNDELHPVLEYAKKSGEEIRQKIVQYQEKLGKESPIIYKRRDDYDEAVQSVNDLMAKQMDIKQEEAQQIYPHYFERFKTDGVEHNIYVGGSISSVLEFNKVFLSNLRLWQLQMMLELENAFYANQSHLNVNLAAASMILAYDQTLSIRYRIDEKRFDVDGAYNARYEVVKKRIDKAKIKDTSERITQKGKIAIIYTDKEVEHEYMRYINYFQHKGLLEDQVEQLELEPVQGVSGLKALRVRILYTIKSQVEPLTFDSMEKAMAIKQVG